MGTRGVWSLENVETKYPQDDWVEYTSVWTEGTTANTAYFLGGGPSPVSKSTVDKIAYATNTTAHAPSADMNTPRNYIVGGGSKTIGYCIAGFNGSTTFSLIEKITYSTDTRDSVSSPAGVPRQQFGVAGNVDKLYMVAGFQGPAGATSDIKSFAFGTETTSSSPSFPSSTLGLSASGNQESGYIGAGAPGGSASQMVKLTYSNDNNSLLPSGGFLSQSRKLPLSAASSSGSYWAGGNPGPYSIVDKLTFATDATARIPGANMVVASAYRGGTNSPSSAYWGSPGQTCDIMPFETDTCSTLPGGANLSSDRGNAVGAVSARENSHTTSLPETRWYDESGESPNISWIPYGPTLADNSYKLDLSTETGADNPSSKMYWARNRLAATGNKTAGYFSSGYYQGSTPYVRSVTDKLVYSNDTNSRLPGSPLPGINGMQYHSAISSETNAYFWAGLKEYPTVYNWTNIYKFTYSTDAMSTNPSNMTGSGNYRGASTNSATAGYETGGATLGQNAIKYTFSTETAEAKSGFMNDAPSPRLYTSGTGNQTAGYYAGGNGYTYIAKVTWSTETAEFTPGNLSGGGQRKNATSNTEKGYWIGGYPTPSGVTDVTTFSTDTTARNPSLESLSPAFTSQNNIIMASVGGRQSGIPVTTMPTATPTSSVVTKYPATLPNFGYQQGNSSLPTGDEVRKLDFATEVGSELPGRLPQGRRDHCSFTSNLASYIAGGQTSTAPANSQIDKTVYATGTSSSVVNGSSDSLEPGRYRAGAAGNQTNGWTMGGNPAKSRIDKFFYSSETNQSDGYWSNDGPGPNGRNWHSTLSAPSYIYAAGGGERSNFWRFTYGISSQQEVPGATLERTPGSPTAYGAEGQIAGLGNKIQGYVGGGNNPGATGGGNPFMQKIVYSTETVSSLGEILTGNRYAVSNCGDLETGYFLGGSPSNAGPNAGKTMKLTYSSETLAVCPAADTASQKSQGHGSGAKSFGIWTDSTPVVI